MKQEGATRREITIPQSRSEGNCSRPYPYIMLNEFSFLRVGGTAQLRFVVGFICKNLV